MTSKRVNMQAALERQAKGYDTPSPASVAVATERPTTSYKQPSRQGKVNVTGYFAPAVKSSFRMIQSAYPDKTIQDLLTEALNDLFAKYNVPQTAHLNK